MSISAAFKRKPVIALSTVALATLCLLPAGTAYAGTLQAPAGVSAAVTADLLTPSEQLMATPWLTTGAVNELGEAVDLADPAVSNFVGWAYYKADGTFTMYNLDDSPKMQGDWTVAADGSTRTLVAKDAAGNVLFTRVVPITVLDGTEFTYRIIPDANVPSVYYDIVHAPTTHVEPGTVTPIENAAELLMATPWETTGAVNELGEAVDLADPAVSNFVGWAYYKADGTFTMYNLDDSPKMQGDWSVSADGTERTLVAKDAAGNVLFTRVVPITVLDGTEFTYRIIPDANVPSVYYDIVHTPTTHVEPGTVTPIANAAEQLMATPWETTGAVNELGEAVDLADPAVSNFVGWAYYKADGTFTMYNLDDSPKMQGDWTVAADGSTRTLVAKDAAGNVLFTRVVPITVLNGTEFTYRIIPDAAVPGVYYDIVHTPTTHPEPVATTTPGGNAGNGALPGEAGAGQVDPPAAGANNGGGLASTGADGALATLAAGLLALLGGAALFLRRRNPFAALLKSGNAEL
ncbi:DUF4822 domain-containing protein [Mycetocola spongiae]|uniref:DUF4822 domain-containing protein n=1 Tax=Mycetocola spongiae TaxID=2859226 RepID=UPI001CF3D031|nr:DUF4822 domain-containing protein [Mycetocola spongiae]UCR87939.1 DUF4822 domain-containing protein [Mycetocola spongiae]